MDFSIILSVISIFIAWMTIGSQRFQIHSLYEDVEETLSQIELDLRSFWSLIDIFSKGKNDDFCKHKIKIVSSDLCDKLYFLIYGKEVAVLRSTLINFNYDLKIENNYFYFTSDIVENMSVDDFNKIFKLGYNKIIKSLENCINEKEKYEGCFKGNWNAFYCFFRSKPLGKAEIIDNAFGLIKIDLKKQLKPL